MKSSCISAHTNINSQICHFGSHVRIWKKRGREGGRKILLRTLPFSMLPSYLEADKQPQMANVTHEIKVMLSVMNVPDEQLN